MAQCVGFDARLPPGNELRDYQVHKPFEQFDATVQFFCSFRLRYYQAFSTVTISFVENKAAECVISLGRPANLNRYGSEREVTRIFLVSLEELYRNGRIQEECEPGTRVYTWKRDNKTMNCVILYSLNHGTG